MHARTLYPQFALTAAFSIAFMHKIAFLRLSCIYFSALRETTCVLSQSKQSLSFNKYKPLAPPAPAKYSFAEVKGLLSTLIGAFIKSNWQFEDLQNVLNSNKVLNFLNIPHKVHAATTAHPSYAWEMVKDISLTLSFRGVP